MRFVSLALAIASLALSFQALAAPGAIKLECDAYRDPQADITAWEPTYSALSVWSKGGPGGVEGGHFVAGNTSQAITRSYNRAYDVKNYAIYESEGNSDGMRSIFKIKRSWFVAKAGTQVVLDEQFGDFDTEYRCTIK